METGAQSHPEILYSKNWSITAGHKPNQFKSAK